MRLVRLPETVHEFPDRLRLPFDFDPAALAADLARAEQAVWTRHFVRANYEGEWSAVALRTAVGMVHPIHKIGPDPNVSTYEDEPILGETPYFRAVLGALACPLRLVRLMRLGPASEIREHSDPDLDAEAGVARLHVPITTGADVDFLVNGRRVEMGPGSLWYLRLSDPHRVVNRGTAARVHLVIDAVVDDWLKAKLREAISGAARIARSGRPAGSRRCGSDRR